MGGSNEGTHVEWDWGNGSASGGIEEVCTQKRAGLAMGARHDRCERRRHH